jgi:hypothetical protein
MIKGLVEIENIVKHFMENHIQVGRPFGATLSRFKIVSNNLTQDLGARVYEVTCEYGTFPPHPQDPRREFVKVRAVTGEIVGHWEV